MLAAITIAAALAFALLALYVGAGLWIYLRQERVLFHPSKEMLCDPSSAGLAFEQCSFRSADGMELEAWFIPADRPRCCVLFCLGNAGNISYYLETASEFHSLGCDLLLFNYRGYGNSGSGHDAFPSEAGVYLDAEAAWDYLVNARGIPAERILLAGRSLGGGTACELALRRPVKALLLESTFKSIPSMAQELYPLYPSALLARIKLDNLAKIPRIGIPTLIAHSFEDELVPHRHGKELFKLSGGSPKGFITLSGSHNDCYFASSASYHAALERFIQNTFEA